MLYLQCRGGSGGAGPPRPNRCRRRRHGRGVGRRGRGRRRLLLLLLLHAICRHAGRHVACRPVVDVASDSAHMAYGETRRLRGLRWLLRLLCRRHPLHRLRLLRCARGLWCRLRRRCQDCTEEAVAQWSATSLQTVWADSCPAFGGNNVSWQSPKSPTVDNAEAAGVWCRV